MVTSSYKSFSICSNTPSPSPVFSTNSRGMETKQNKQRRKNNKKRDFFVNLLVKNVRKNDVKSKEKSVKTLCIPLPLPFRSRGEDVLPIKWEF